MRAKCSSANSVRIVSILNPAPSYTGPRFLSRFVAFHHSEEITYAARFSQSEAAIADADKLTFGLAEGLKPADLQH